MFSFEFVCEQNNRKSYGWILMKFGIRVGYKLRSDKSWLNFGRNRASIRLVLVIVQLSYDVKVKVKLGKSVTVQCGKIYKSTYLLLSLPV